MKYDKLNKIIEETVKRELVRINAINESINPDSLKLVKQNLYQAHKELNQILRDMMMQGQGESEEFNALSKLDQYIQQIMGHPIIDRISTV